MTDLTQRIRRTPRRAGIVASAFAMDLWLVTALLATIAWMPAFPLGAAALLAIACGLGPVFSAAPLPAMPRNRRGAWTLMPGLGAPVPDGCRGRGA